MKKINKILSIVIAICTIICISTVTYASTISIEKVKEQGTPINFDEGNLTKNITGIENNELTIQLNISMNNIKTINSNSEVLFLIDNSDSMNTTLEDGVTKRKTKVIKSTEELIKKINTNNPNVKMGIISFSSSPQVIQDFTNDKNILVNTCENFVQESPGGKTNMANALSVAKQKFSSNVKNKILILLTDGIPTDGDEATKTQLQEENVYIISTLVGLNSTSQEKITSIFGTEQNPTADRFYNIADNDIETTISNNIYNRIIEDFQSSLANVAIKDYFSEEILNNFEINILNSTKGEAIMNDNAILWNIANIGSSENVTLTYTLKLKNEYDVSLINKVMNTNQKVEFEYINMLENTEKKEMIDSPQIKIKSEEISNKDDKTTGTKTDGTTVNDTIPYTGTNIIILLVIFLGIIISIILKKKLNSMKNIK